MSKEILIVGGGAAGLMAAVCAKEENPSARVTVIEANDRVGKKLLTTGNGRCNLTNAFATAADYAPAKVAGVFDRMPPQKVMEKFAERNNSGNREQENASNNGNDSD